MPRQKITARLVERMQPASNGTRVEIWDTYLPGFLLTVHPTGRRSFSIMTYVNGRRVRSAIGRWPIVQLDEAREIAREKLFKASQGKDPRRKRETAELTVEKAIDLFIERYAMANTKSWALTKDCLDRDLRAKLGNRRVKDIGKGDILTLIDTVVDRGSAVQANRLLAHVRKMFNWLIERGYIETNPCAGIKKPAPENKRDRVLKADELAKLWNMSPALGTVYNGFVRMLILTMQRRGEVSNMRWSQLNLEDGIWEIAGADNKAGRTHTVPLSRQALEILELMPRFDGCDYVFTTTGNVPINGFTKSKKTLSEAIELDDWTWHDLRRTGATNLAQMRIDRTVISKILNHADQSVTAIYERHRYDEEKADALQAWADRIDELTQTAKD